MKDIWNDLCHYGDILAIPFFLLATYYFHNKEVRTPLENLLLFFSISGFIMDIVYTATFFYTKR